MNEYTFAHWPARFGFADDAEQLSRTGRVDHGTVAARPDAATMRAQHLSLTRLADKRYRLNASYLYQHGALTSQSRDFLTLDFVRRDDKITLEAATVFGHPQDLQDPDIGTRLSRVSSALFASIGRRCEWINPVAAFKEAGFDISMPGTLSLPGLYPGGEFKRVSASITPSNSAEPVIPAIFLPSVIGADPAIDRERLTRSLTLPYDDQNALYTLTMTTERGKTPLHLKTACDLTRLSGETIETARLYEIETAPHKGKIDAGEIKQLAVYLPNRGDAARSLEKIDLTDAIAVAAALDTGRRLATLAKAGTEGLRADMAKKPAERRLFLPTDIHFLTGLNDAVDNTPPPTRQNGRMVLQIIGGVPPEKPFISEYDTHIGANSEKIDYYRQGEKRAKSGIIDAGVLFHDKFDVTLANIGKYLRHRYDKAHEPESDVQFLLISHKHKDHIAQLALLVKKGYILPPLIMPCLSKPQVLRDMRELGVERKIQAQIMANCYTVDTINNIDRLHPEKIYSRKVAGQTIQQWTEVLPGKLLGSQEYFPRLRIGDFEIRVGPMPHSDPGNMYDIITPAGSHRYTGDYKVDTLQLPQGDLKIWLAGHQPDSMTAESTGALRDPAIRASRESEIGDRLAQEFWDHPSSRFMCPMLGSNTARLLTAVAALGQAGRRYLVVDGKAVEDLKRDLDNVYDLTGWAKRVHGVEIVTRAASAKILETAAPGTMALLVTGTQDEAYSSMNRALRDWLPAHRFGIQPGDVIVPLQGLIPVGENKPRRDGMFYFAEKFHDASVVYLDAVVKEAQLSLSGHPGPIEMKQMIVASGKPVVIPVHGDPANLIAHADMAREVGAEARRLDLFEKVEIQRGRKVIPFRREAGEFVGVQYRTPSKEQFYLRRNFASTVFPLKARDLSVPGSLVAAFEQAAKTHIGTALPGHTLLDGTPSFLTQISAQTGGSDFLAQHLPFGIEKYGSDVFEAKRIALVAGLDTETTGRDPRTDVIVDYALVATTLGGRTVEKTELRQAMPAWHIADPEALMVTRTTPKSLEAGLPQMQFAAALAQSFKTLKNSANKYYHRKHPDDPTPRERVKVVLAAHNFRFDDRFMRTALGVGLHDKTRPHSTDGIIGVDTRNVARALHAIMPDKFKVNKKAEFDFLDFSLEGLCTANGIPFDDRRAHGATVDAGRALALFRRQRDLAPTVVGQMIINADTATGHLLSDMSGIDMGFGGPQPVFSYVSPLAVRPDLRIGTLLGTVGGGRYAVVANLGDDPAGLLAMSDASLVSVLRDRDNGRLELIDLRAQPIILPAAHYFHTPQGRKMPRETIDARAGAIGRNLNAMETEGGWKTLAERLEALWGTQAAALIAAREPADDAPDLHAALPANQLPSGRRPDQDASGNQRIRALSAFNPVSQIAQKSLSAYRRAVVSMEEAEGRTARRAHRSEARGLYTTLARRMPDNLLLNNVHYDIAPQDLTPHDRRAVESYRAWHGYRTVVRAEESLNRLRALPKDTSFAGRRASALLGEIEAYVAEKAAAYPLNDVGRLHVHGWRETLSNRPGQRKEQPKPAA